MKAAVVVFPGINRERDMARASSGFLWRLAAAAAFLVLLLTLGSKNVGAEEFAHPKQYYRVSLGAEWKRISARGMQDFAFECDPSACGGGRIALYIFSTFVPEFKDVTQAQFFAMPRPSIADRIKQFAGPETVVLSSKEFERRSFGTNTFWVGEVSTVWKDLVDRIGERAYRDHYVASSFDLGFIYYFHFNALRGNVGGFVDRANAVLTSFEPIRKT